MVELFVIVEFVFGVLYVCLGCEICLYGVVGVKDGIVGCWFGLICKCCLEVRFIGIRFYGFIYIGYVVKGGMYVCKVNKVFIDSVRCYCCFCIYNYGNVSVGISSEIFVIL